MVLTYRTKIAEKNYVEGNIFEKKSLLEKLDALPRSCVESARVLSNKRSLYEIDNVFPKSIIDYIIKMLHNEKDEFMNQYLADLPADDRLHETRKIMHKDLHHHLKSYVIFFLEYFSLVLRVSLESGQVLRILMFNQNTKIHKFLLKLTYNILRIILSHYN